MSFTLSDLNIVEPILFKVRTKINEFLPTMRVSVLTKSAFSINDATNKKTFIYDASTKQFPPEFAEGPALIAAMPTFIADATEEVNSKKEQYASSYRGSHGGARKKRHSTKRRLTKRHSTKRRTVGRKQ